MLKDEDLPSSLIINIFGINNLGGVKNMKILVETEYRHVHDKYRSNKSKNTISETCPIATAINEFLRDLIVARVTCSGITFYDTTPWNVVHITKIPTHVGSWILDIDTLNLKTSGAFTEVQFRSVAFIIEIPEMLIF